MSELSRKRHLSPTEEIDLEISDVTNEENILPTEKNIVTLMCKFIRVETREVKSKRWYKFQTLFSI